jgi:serine/threonine protein kinase
MSQNNNIIRGHYRIERELGRGGFGITYLSVDLDLPSHPQVVVKKLSPQKNNINIFSIAKERFETEAKVLERLGEQHEQIPELLAYFEENFEFYLVQEFVDGDDLRHEIIKGLPLSENKVINILQGVLEILEFVHHKRIIHRDIKPSNLMRRRSDGKIVLIDFGAIKEVSTLEVNDNRELYSTCNIGTPGYKPLEQEQGYPQLSSDIYALGIVGIQAITGLHPEQLEKDQYGNLNWRKHAPDINNALADVLNRMVHPNLEERYKSATEALSVLRTVNEITFVEPTLPESTQNTLENNSPQRLSQNSFNIMLSNLPNNRVIYPFIIILFLILSFLGFDYYQKSKSQLYEVKIDLNDVCQQDFIYEEIDEIKNKIPYKKIGPKYNEEFNQVWPVFRWVCLYQLQPTKKYRFESPKDIKSIGMDLDRYCQKKYPDKEKASHHDYHDKNSLYCTRPHP